MKRPRMPRPSRQDAVEYFSFGPWEFDVTLAAKLAGNTEKYQPESRRPSPEWVGPNIDIDQAHIERSDPYQPIIFATIIQDGDPWPLLIDGHHRVLKALRQHTPVRAITLDLADSLKILKAPPHTIEQMKREGRELGLLA